MTQSDMTQSPSQTLLARGIPVSTKSPFQDGYDIDAERLALADLIESDNPDSADPRWGRYLELQEREALLRQQSSAYKLRDGADVLVSDMESSGTKKLAAMEPEEVEYMTIHTKEGYRLFTGRARDPERKLQRIIGGRRAAAAFKALWYLSGNDNPYADWALIDLTEQMNKVSSLIEFKSKTELNSLQMLKRRGLEYSVLRATDPQKVALGFRSPYGFMVAELLVSFDYFVRLIKTMVRRDKLTDAQGSDAIREVVRKGRNVFTNVVRMEALLMSQSMAQISRRDWLPGADGASRERVTAAIALLGPVPRDVMTGKVQPRHGRRRSTMTKEEQQQLHDVSLDRLDGEGASGEEALL